MAENRVIGRKNALPWHLPADLKRFKALTTGHAVIVGRKTFESIGRALAGRRMIVLTHERAWRRADVEAAASLDGALELASGDAEVFVAGGAQVYAHALPRADRIYLTVVHAEIAGDARFPELDPSQWKLVEDERHDADDKNALAYSFRRYRRVRATGNVQGTTD